MNDHLQALIEKARKRVAGMSPEERAAMWAEQRRSFCRTEVMFGNDADEARYRAAVEAGDDDEIRRMDSEAEARGYRFDARWEAKG